MPTLTVQEWGFMVGLYLIAWSALQLIVLGVRGWRGPSSRDLLSATATVARWMAKANRNKQVRVRHIIIHDNGHVESLVYRKDASTGTWKTKTK